MRSAVVLILLALTWMPAAGGKEALNDTNHAAFAAVVRMDSELERGVSVMADVRKLLGEPNGHGECLLPGQNEASHVWYYEDLAIKSVKQVGRLATIEMRQKILLVFFDGDRFDGYLWTSNSLRSATD